MDVSSSDMKMEFLNKSEDVEINLVTSTEDGQFLEIESSSDIVVAASSSGVVVEETQSVEATPSDNNRQILRFLHVKGFDNRTNDLIYAPPLQTEYQHENGATGVESSTSDPDQTRILIYFGGDIQDFPDRMELKSKQQHFQWNLENTTLILRVQFPDHHIVVVRPNRMTSGEFACFDNFVRSNDYGIPEHVPYHGALLHLRRLLQKLANLLQELDTNSETGSDTRFQESGKRSRLKLNTSNLTLVGFSKGSVVLNQFVYEMHYFKTLTPDDTSFDEFLDSIKAIYWLDGGHAGGKNTWIASRSILETLARAKVEIQVHVTPFQIANKEKKGAGREEKFFSEYLHQYGAPIKRFYHFEHHKPSLSIHFQLIAEFSNPTVQDTLALSEEYGSFREISVLDSSQISGFSGRRNH